MKENTPTSRAEDKDRKDEVEDQPGDRPEWTTPKLEDVSGKVMAQPYIRFT